MPDVNSTSLLRLPQKTPVPDEKSEEALLGGNPLPRSPFLPSKLKTSAPLMNTQIQFKGLSVRPTVRAWIEDGIRELRSLAEITAALVLVERCAGLSPAMQLHVRLALSGPAIHAAVTEHTVQAAWLKAVRNLRRQIQRRNMKLRRRNTGEQLVHGPENRWNGSLCR